MFKSILSIMRVQAISTNVPPYCVDKVVMKRHDTSHQLPVGTVVNRRVTGCSFHFHWEFCRKSATTSVLFRLWLEVEPLVAADINQEPLLLLKNFILWPSLCVFRHYWSIICTLGSVIFQKLIYSLEDAWKGIDTSKV